MLLALVGAALAAVPFRLPPGEPADAWAAPLHLADFALVDAVPIDGPYAELRLAGGTWEIVVRDVEGSSHRATVSAPVDARRREDIVWMAQSLLDPGVPPFGGPSPSPPAPPPHGAPAPAPPPRRSASPPPAPTPTRPALPDAAPEPAPVASEPPVAPPTVAEPPGAQPNVAQPTVAEPTAAEPTLPAPPAPLPAAPSPRRAALPPPFAAARVGMRMRESVAPAGVLDLAGGARLGAAFGALEVSGALPAGLAIDPALGAGTVAGLRGGGLLGVGTRGPVGGGVYLGGGVSLYRFAEEGSSVVATVPVGGVFGGLTGSLAVGAHVTVQLDLRAGLDAGVLHLTVGEQAFEGWSRGWVEPTVGVRFGGG